MTTLRTYDIFISHKWRYSDSYDRIVGMLNRASNLRWRNLSVPQHDPIYANDSEALEQLLRDQMRPAHVFLILGGMYVSHSDWIDFEIQFARRVGRPIVGIRPWGSERTPLAVASAAKEIVGWNTSSVVTAIRAWALPES